MDILSKILGSPARVKIMRLFLLNKEEVFTNKDIATKSKVTPETVRKEVRTLSGVGFIKKDKKSGWAFDHSFRYTREFEGLLVKADTFQEDQVATSFKKAGRIKLLLISGFFIKDKDSRLDILLVGDKVNRSKVEDNIRRLEAEFGKELTYAVFDTKEFLYRLSMYDKLVRDVLDFPHRILIQGRDIAPKLLKKV